jgi:hypothetical protein
MRWANCALVLAGLLSTSCVGVIGLGTAAVAVGAVAIAYTCYDRVSVTVTDRLTGAQLCDAKVTFIEGTSATEATSCYQAALSTGKYVLRVERPGLVKFEQPVEVVKGGKCGQTVQTMYVALDRVNGVQPPQKIAPTAGPSAPPPPAPPPAATVTSPSAPVPPPSAVPAPSAPALAAPAPSAVPAPSAPAPSAVPASSAPAPSAPVPVGSATGSASAPPAGPPPASTSFPDAR